MPSIPTPDDISELLLSCRYGDLEDVQLFVQSFGAEPIAEAVDERGNNVLHMCCGNGHVDVLKYLLPLVPTSLISKPNSSSSPPLHWAILNSHIECVKTLASLPESSGGGVSLLQKRNGAGRDAFEESVWAGEGREEVSGYIEGFLARSEGEPGGGGLDDPEDERDVKLSMQEGSGGMKIERIGEKEKPAGDKGGVEAVVKGTEGLKVE